MGELQTQILKFFFMLKKEKATALTLGKELQRLRLGQHRGSICS